MATIELTGRLADITSRPVESITRVTVKAPTFMPNGAGEITTTQPANVDFDADGKFSVGVVQGVGWLFIEGDSWSDSIRFVAAAGMTTMNEAVINALPFPTDMLGYLDVKAGAEQAIEDALAKAITALSTSPNSWYRGNADDLLLTTIDDAPQGVVEVYGTKLATLGIPGTGFTIVETLGAGSVKTQTAHQVTQAGDRVVHQRQRFGNTTGWGAWSTSTGRRNEYRGQIPSGTSLDTFVGESYDGVWHLSGTASANAPEVGVAFLEVESPLGVTVHRYTVPYTGHMYLRRYLPSAGEFSAWQLIGGNGGDGGSALLDHHVRVERLRAEVKHRKVTTKAVSIVFDHGTNNFNEIVLPMLKERNLPATICLNSQMYDRSMPRFQHDSRTTWAVVDSWTKTGLVELANHGATHRAVAEDDGKLSTEIEQAYADLSTNLPNTRIDTWVQAGADLGDFKQGADVQAFADTTAGRMILKRHAIVVSAVTPQYWPLTGEPRLGMSRYWFDTPTGTASTKTRINNVPQGYGTIVSAHPELLNTSGNNTTSQLREFLDWLVAERDAGRIEILPLKEMAFATYGSIELAAGASITDASLSTFLAQVSTQADRAKSQADQAAASAASFGNTTVVVETEAQAQALSLRKGDAVFVTATGNLYKEV